MLVSVVGKGGREEGKEDGEDGVREGLEDKVRDTAACCISQVSHRRWKGNLHFSSHHIATYLRAVMNLMVFVYTPCTGPLIWDHQTVC